MEFLTEHKIPVGALSNSAVLWLKLHAAGFFSLVRRLLGAGLESAYALFMNPPPVFVFILLFAAVLFPACLSFSYIRRLMLIAALLAVFFADCALFGGQPWLTCFCLCAAAGLAAAKRQILFAGLRGQAVRGQGAGGAVFAGAGLRAAGLCAIAAVAAAACLFAAPYIAPQFVFIALLAVIAWFLQERWSCVALAVAGFLFVLNQGYWRDTMETLVIVFWSCIVCLGAGVPLGIYSAHHPRFYRWLQPALDLMQTLPAFVYLIPALFFFRIGMVPGLLATVIFVLPAPVRLTQAGIASAPKELLEAAQAFGANRRQLLWKVELPHALPELRAGMTQTIMLSLSMVVITATVGGNGLGVKVYRALQTGNVALGFEAGCVIVAVAIVLDRVFRLRQM